MHGYVRGSFTQSLVTIAVQLPPKKSPNWLTKKFSWANAAQCSIYTPTHQMLHAAPTSVRKLIKLSLQHDWAVSHRFSHWRHVQRQATAAATGNWQHQRGGNNDNYQRQSLQWQPKLAITSEWWRYIIIDDVRVCVHVYLHVHVDVRAGLQWSSGEACRMAKTQARAAL